MPWRQSPQLIESWIHPLNQAFKYLTCECNARIEPTHTHTHTKYSIHFLPILFNSLSTLPVSFPTLHICVSLDTHLLDPHPTCRILLMNQSTWKLLFDRRACCSSQMSTLMQSRRPYIPDTIPAWLTNYSRTLACASSVWFFPNLNTTVHDFFKKWLCRRTTVIATNVGL